MSESIEFDLLVNGKPAVKSINEVEKAQEDLDKTVDKTSKNIKTNWTAIGASVAIVTAAMGAAMKQSLDLEKATFGLTNATKEYIRAASEQYGMSQEVIAGFVQTGKAAGMSGEEIKKMIDQAVALGRAFPHESTESFVDNLVQLNRTGEAQGYIVDILEQKYGLLDQKLLDTDQKMLAVEEATKGVNEAYDKTRSLQMERTFQEISNSTKELGDTLWDIADSSGALWATQKAFLGVQLAANGYAQVIAYIKSLGWFGADVQKAESDLRRLGQEATNIRKQLGGQDVTKTQTTTPDISGKDKSLSPFAPNITKEWIDQQVKANEKILAEQKNASAKREAEAKRAGDALKAERERQLQETIAINAQFMDEYNMTTMNAYDYELSLLDKQYEEYKKHVTDKAKLDEWYNEQKQRLLNEYDAQMTAYAEMGDRLTSGLTRGIEDFTRTGKLNFKEMANSIIQDMLKIQIQSSMMSLFGGFNSGGGGLLGGAFSMLFNAKGNAFSNGNVTPFANGGIVSSPTMFPMANGMGLMGEAGAEAIMPLKRTASGDLGVKSTPPVVNVNVQNYGNDNVQVEQRGDNIEVIISQIASSISRGTGDVGKAIEGRYGLRKQ